MSDTSRYEPGEPVEIEQLTGDLNVVLSKADIDAVIQHVLGPRGEKIGSVFLASDYCCVDAAVGSSVAGPVSSVASSVSHEILTLPEVEFTHQVRTAREAARREPRVAEPPATTPGRAEARVVERRPTRSEITAEIQLPDDIELT